MSDSIFEPQMLIDAACKAVGSDDLWGDHYREGLDILCDAIVREAELRPARVAKLTQMFVGLLATRGRIAAALSRRGDVIASTPIERPIFITGLPRTGTTMLHNLMSSLDGLRAYTPWEMRCVVPKQEGPQWREIARRETAGLLQGILDGTPELAQIHLMTSDTPDECNWLTRHSFASLVFGYMLHVPSYVQWLFGRSQLRSYSEHRVQLQILADRERAEPPAQLVLKDPSHLWHLSELLDTYPDALIVRLHRDPVEAVASLCSLLHAFQRTDSGRSDPVQIGPEVLEMVALGVAREREVRSSPRAQRFMDIEFRALMADPIAAVRTICERANHPFDDRMHSQATDWLRDNPRHKGGRHAYTAASFGLDEREIRERIGAG